MENDKRTIAVVLGIDTKDECSPKKVVDSVDINVVKGNEEEDNIDLEILGTSILQVYDIPNSNNRTFIRLGIEVATYDGYDVEDIMSHLNINVAEKGTDIDVVGFEKTWFGEM